MDRPVVLWDEPSHLAREAEKLWERLDRHADATMCPPDRVFLRWAELEEQFAKAAQIRFSDLALGDAEPETRISTRPSMAFHGNMPVAVAEVRNIVERGGRAVFFAATGGELERLADIFQEYSVPYQLGFEPTGGGASGFLAERAYMAGPAASTFLVKGQVRRGTVFLDPLVAMFGSEDLFDVSELVARPAGKRALGASRRTWRTSSRAITWFTPSTASDGFSGFGKSRTARPPATTCCSSTPGTPGCTCRSPAWTWCRSSAARATRGARARQARRGHLGAHQEARQGQDARHGRGTAQALCRAQTGRGLCLLARQQLAAGVRGRLRIRRDSRSVDRHRRGEARHGERAAHGPAAVRRRGVRQNGGRHARGLQGAGRRAPGGGAGSHHRALLPALRDVQAALRAVSGARRDAEPLRVPERPSRPCSRTWPKARSIS